MTPLPARRTRHLSAGQAERSRMAPRSGVPGPRCLLAEAAPGVGGTPPQELSVPFATSSPHIGNSFQPFQCLAENRPNFSPRFIHTSPRASTMPSPATDPRGGHGDAGVEQEERAGPGCAGARPGDASRPGRPRRPRRSPAPGRAPAFSRSHGSRRGRGTPPDSCDGVGSSSCPAIPASRAAHCDRRRYAACGAFPHAGAGGGRHAGATRSITSLPAHGTVPAAGSQPASDGSAIHPLAGPAGHLSPGPGKRTADRAVSRGAAS